MATLIECVQRFNEEYKDQGISISEVERKMLAEQIQALKKRGVDTPTLSAVDERIRIEEEKRRGIQIEVEKRGGVVPPFSPSISMQKEEEVVEPVEEEKGPTPPRTMTLPKEASKDIENYYYSDEFFEESTFDLIPAMRERIIGESETISQRAKRKKVEKEAEEILRENMEEVSSEIFYGGTESEIQAINEAGKEAKRRIAQRDERAKEKERAIKKGARAIIDKETKNRWDPGVIEDNGKEVPVYSFKNARVIKTSQKKIKNGKQKVQWLLSEKDKDGNYVRWGTYDSARLAVEAYHKGLKPEELETAKVEEQKEERSGRAKEVLDTINDKKKYKDLFTKISGVINRIRAEKGYPSDPTLVDQLVQDAIIDASETFDPDAGTTFSTWATIKARNALSDQMTTKEGQFPEEFPEGNNQDTAFSPVGKTKAATEEVKETGKGWETVELSEEEKADILERVNKKKEKEAPQKKLEEEKREAGKKEKEPEKKEEKKTVKRKKASTPKETQKTVEEEAEAVAEDTTTLSNVGELSPQEILDQAREDMEILQALPDDATNEQVAQALGYYDIDMSKEEAVATYQAQIDQLVKNLEGKKTDGKKVVRRKKAEPVDKSPDNFMKATVVKVIDTANPPKEKEWSREEVHKNWRPATIHQMTRKGEQVVQIVRNGKHIRYLAKRVKDKSLWKSEADYWLEEAGGNPYLAESLFEKAVREGTGLTEQEENRVRRDLTQTIKNVTRMREIFEKKYPTAYDLVKKAADDGNRITSMLSNALLNNPEIVAKLKKVEVVKKSNLTRAGSSYSKSAHRIEVGMPNPATYLHEAVHAITVREMDVNEEFRKEVEGMLQKARKAAIADPNIDLNAIEVEYLSTLESSDNFTSQFEPRLDGDIDLIGIAYGLLNPREFLSQAFSSRAFQRFLSTVEVEKPARVKEPGVWNAFKDLLYRVAEALWTNPTKKFTLLEQALTIVPQSSDIDISNWQMEEKYYIPSESDSLPETLSKVSKKREPPVRNEAYWDKVKEDLSTFDETDTFHGKLKKWGKDALRTFSDVAKSVGDTVRENAPELARPLMKMEYKINRLNREYQERVQPFFSKFRALSKEDRYFLHHLLHNSNHEEYRKKRDEVLRKFKMMDAFEEVEKVFDEIRERSRAVGLRKTEDIPGYYPRRVKDIREFMAAIKEDPEYNIIQAEMDRLGPKASLRDKQDAINRLFNTGSIPAIALLDPGSTKARSFPVVPREFRHFYESADEALINHIYEMNEEITKREFFEDPKRKVLVREMDKAYKKLLLDDKRHALLKKEIAKRPEVKDNKRKKANLEKRIKKLRGLLLSKDKRAEQAGIVAARQEQIETGEWDRALESIMLDNYENMTRDQVDAVLRSVRARLAQKGMNGSLASIRNLALASVLGNPTSAITQIGDLAFSIYAYGPSNTVKAILGNKILRPEDLDLSHSLKEFQQFGTAKWLDNVLSWSGLKSVDRFGKTTTMNSAFKKAQNQSLEEFRKEHSDILAQDTDATWEAIQKGVNNELTQFFAFKELSRWQPVSLSEMPIKYLTGGNGRIFYALKSYNIKAINNLYRELTTNWKDGDAGARAEAGWNMGRLLFFMVMMGATADELKDFLLGKDAGTFSDNVHENILKVLFTSRYTLEKGFRGDPIETFLGDVLLPPTRFITDPFKDAYSLFTDKPDFRSITNLPWGNIPYSWISPVEESKDMRRLKEEINKAYAEGKSFGAIRKRMNKYNAWARKNKETLITLSSLSQARKRKIKEEREK